MESAAASAFLKAVMGRLFMALEKEYNKHKGLSQEAQSLQQDLRMIAAVMDDQLRALGRTNDARARTAVARLHAEEMLDLAHDIEDCVDRFLHRLTCRRQRGAGAGAGPGASSSSLVRRMAHELSKVQSRSSFADEIQKLKRRIREAQQRVIDIKPIVDVITGGGGGGDGQPTGAAGSSSTLPCRAARSPVGLVEPVEELLSLLDEVDGQPEQTRVISVVGFGGSGKTTLAKAVYDDPRAKDRFPCRAWVTVASSPENSNGTTAILRAVLQQVLPKDDAMGVDEQHDLETSLKEYLKDKRYLIVIDDIGMDQWSIIRSTFEDNGTSSRIIVTTMIQSVANMCSHGNGYVYQMNTLGEEDSKELAFPGFRSPELEQGSASLLGKCDGLPLALVSVSDYLKSSSEPTGELCAKLCRNLGSHLKEQDGHYSFSKLSKVLHDNYDNFSGYTLSCLLYLGIFPNNCPLKKKVLIRRWLAEGYARSDSLRSEEDIADENFSKLIDRNIIRPVDTRNNSEVKTCKTHGIIHEFLLNKSLSQIFIAKSSRDHPRLSVNTNARHLSFHADQLTECVASDEELSRVRSLTIFGDAGEAIFYVQRCKLIRVLDLQECNDLDDDHLKYICKLWHLKYLSFGGNISELPRSIEGLHCLETLDLRRTEIKFLPIEAIMLPHLAHLFGKFMLHKDDVKSVNKMSRLQKFFSSKKSNLHTLAGFITDESKGFLQHIGDMKRLRKVKIWIKHVAGSNNYIADLSQAIQDFTKAPIDRDIDHSLSLDSEECPENFLSSLDLKTCSEGSKYALRSLKLNGKLHQLPPFVTLLSGLTELCISSATLTRNHLSALINLNRLLYIKLVAYKFNNFEIKPGAFPSLRRLCFVVKSVTSALPTIKHGALPNLISLGLLCQGLVGLSGIEITHMKHLKEITINSGVDVQWEQAAKNHPNRPKVLFLTKVSLVEREDNERTCAVREQSKICKAQPTSSDGLNKMRLSEASSSRLRMIVQQSTGGLNCH
ncbi:disease resistance protein RGA4-like [Oryza brachyantha]|uniref:disease resistance protein RGA4-like n=1 Tax=Oryza brachyantha TaxID=4533 RepID=UPI001ADD3672|nr:disease resistance protein RGA4-like [Oryza brachyantha]